MTRELAAMFARPPIGGSTINSVPLPPSFCVLIYAMTALVLAFGAAYWVMRKHSLRAAFKKAVVAAFMFSGLAYSVHADLGWAAWLLGDLENLGGLDAEERLMRLDGQAHLHAVVSAARAVLRPEYMLFADDEYTRLRAEFILLPLRKRERAGDILVLGDSSAHYDPGTRTLTRGTLTIADVDPVFVFSRRAYVLRKR